MRKSLFIAVVAAAIVVATVPAALAAWNEGQAPNRQQQWSLESGNGCAEAFFIGARGSGQNGRAAGPLNMGDQIERLYREFGEDIQSTPVSAVRSARISVNYPAFAPQSILDDGYFGSIAVGADDINRLIREVTTRCGTRTRFVLTSVIPV